MTQPAANPSDTLATEICLRPETAEDESFLLSVYASTRQDELNATGWDEAARQAFLRMQFNAQRQGYRGMFPTGSFLIILRGGERVGRMVVCRAPDEIRLVDIALPPAFQSQGIGTRLLKDLITEASATGKPLRVSVFRPGRAAAFYQRLGFVNRGGTGLYDQWEWLGPAGLKSSG
jgi:GNAT superfamily N-acetyltransferase